MAIEWSKLSNGEAEELLSTDFTSGLTRKAVAHRRKRLGKNAFSHKYFSYIKTLEKSFFSFSLIAFLLCLCVSFFVIPRPESVILLVLSAIFLSVLALEFLKTNTLALKSQSVFTKKILTLRDGREKLLSIDSLVVGDVIKLSEGDELPFDAFIISGSGLCLEEKGYVSNGIIEGGSKISSGSCTCALIDVNGCSQADAVNGFIGYFSDCIPDHEHSFSKRLAIFLYIATAIISLFIIIVSKKGSVAFESFFTGVIISNGILPCFFVGIYSFIYSNLFFNSRKKLNIKSAKSVKMLTDLECAIFDSSLIFNADNPTPIAFFTGGTAISSDSFDIEDRRIANFKNALFSVEYGILSIEGAEKNKANSLSSLFKDRFIPKYPLTSYRLKSDDFPFDTFLFKNSENQSISVIKGDLYSILKRCISASYNEKGSSLDEASKKAIIDAAQRLSSLGLEIEAYALGAKEDFSLDSTHLAHKRLSFLGFVAYSKGISPECEEFLSFCEKKEIEPIIIHNGSKEELGMLLSGSKFLKRFSYLDCKNIGEDEADIKNALSSCNIFLNPSEIQTDKIVNVIAKNGVKAAYITGQKNSKSSRLRYVDEICRNKLENEIIFTSSLTLTPVA